MTDPAERRSRPYAPRMNPEQRREQLLDAVLRIIVRDSIHKVSMDAVAKEAGVTRPVVYGHFKDSDALKRASLNREEQGVMTQFGEVIAATMAATPEEATLTLLDGFLRAVLAAPDRWRAVFTLVDSSTPAFRKRVERGKNALIALFEQLIRARSADTSAEPDIELQARVLFVLIWDAGRTVLAEPERFPPDRITDFARRWVRNGY